MEAVAIVTAIDPARRSVRVETPKGQTVVAVPPGTDLGGIQVGSRYRVRYSEPVAVAIERGSSAAGGATAAVEPTGPRTGEGVKMDTVRGTVQELDRQHIVLRTPDGGRQSFRLGEGVLQEGLKPGDSVTLNYQQAVATQMASTPQPVADPAPAQ
jgi:hypothetical protein